MRISGAAIVISALLTQVSYAQMAVPGPVPPSDAEKAETSKKKADEIATDQAYKSTLKRTQDSTQKVDPWGGIRTAPDTGKH